MFPRLLDLGSLTIHTYGFLMAVAFISGLSLASWRASKEGIEPHQVWDLGVLMILTGMIGSKILLVFSQWAYYSRNAGEIVSLSTLRAGGVWYGGLLAALAATFIYVRRKRLPAWTVADVFAPSVALGHGLGRLGCFFAGCDYGRPTAGPLGVTYTDEYANQTVGVPLNVPLHPTQLYEAFAELLIFLFLLLWYSRKKFEGQLVCLYLVCYGAIRFVIEFYRGDPDRGFVFGSNVSTSQFISLLLVPSALILLWRRSRSRQHA